MAKSKLNKMSPCAKLEKLRQMVKEGHRYQHQAQLIMSQLGISLPSDSTEADHAILGYMAKGNRHWLAKARQS